MSNTNKTTKQITIKSAPAMKENGFRMEYFKDIVIWDKDGDIIDHRQCDPSHRHFTESGAKRCNRLD